MTICCLDLEGVLVPEIWIEVSKKTKIPELRLTTRDVPDYDILMRRRLKILRQNGIRLRDVQDVISRIEPLPAAKKFLDTLRGLSPVVILSDTYYEFAGPLLQKLGMPVLFCNGLTVDGKGFISGYRLRQKNGKQKAVRALQSAGFEVRAAGDSYNDILMLKAAHRGVLFNPPKNIAREFPTFKVTRNYRQLLASLRGGA